MLKEFGDHFRVAGEVLDYIIHPTGDVARSKMISTLTHALLWFHEACRESITLLAIVKYAAALDSLACGEGNDGICCLIKARLKISDDTQILKDGTTLKQAVYDIYGYGRNHTIHGKNKKLLHDWTETNGIAEHLARHCLNNCITLTAQNVTDNPKQFAKS
jgi:hypothetical protein